VEQRIEVYSLSFLQDRCLGHQDITFLYKSIFSGSMAWASGLLLLHFYINRSFHIDSIIVILEQHFISVSLVEVLLPIRLIYIIRWLVMLSLNLLSFLSELAISSEYVDGRR
jgi:hypothetical protein